jgi:clan AA aspartic protease
MIYGTVNSRREPTVSLRFRGPNRTVLKVSVLIDTGHDGVIALPPAVLSALGLVGQIGGVIQLADGGIRQFGTYVVEVEWHDGWRTVQVSGFGNPDAVLGMEMLDGHELRVEATPGGVVEIVPLP